MTIKFPIYYQGQMYSFAQTLNILELIINLIKQIFNTHINRYKVAISVLKTMKDIIKFNIQDYKPKKEEIKITIDVIKEIQIYNVPNETQKRDIEDFAKYLKFLIEIYY